MGNIVSYCLEKSKHKISEMVNMELTSTRGGQLRCGGYEAIFRGIAPDGGLYVPTTLPALSPSETSGLSYAALTARILSLLLPGVSQTHIRAACEAAYPARFDTPAVCPLVRAGDLYVLELFHGETAAFKDMALSVMPSLLAFSRTALGVRDTALILTATSGDTGSAAMNGFRGLPGTAALVLYPRDGISEIQKRQMTAMPGSNVAACAVNGNFDDCQRAVKQAFLHLAPPAGIRFSSANSINIARLTPQIAYYYAAYHALVREQALPNGTPVTFVVPTGNFGDILAGLYAREMGLPVAHLVCASNANRVLTDFLATGVYDARRPLARTLSPSMDILVSSNLERLLFHAEEGNARAVRESMQALAEDGVYRVSDAALQRIQRVFRAYAYTDADTLESMDRAFRDTGYLPDPHTTIAFAAAEAYRRENPGIPCVCLATASPFKFPQSGLRALNLPEDGSAFDMQDALSAAIGVPVPRALAPLRSLRPVHTDETAVHDIPEYILEKAATLCRA